MTTEILIFGAGAIGAFYGSRLALNEAVNVSVVCRSNYHAVSAHGFSITSPQYGDYHWTPSRTFSSPIAAQRSGVRWDYILVTTKALPDVSDDSAQLEGVVRDGTAIVLIQNGLGVEAPYAKRFSSAVILSAVTIASAAQPTHGNIKHNRWTRINSGPFPSNHALATERNQTFVDLLTRGGGIEDASAYSAEKMQLLRWHKIAINAAMNPSSVLSGGTDNASMAKDSDLYEHLRGLMNEVMETGPMVIGAPFPPEFATAEQILKSTLKNPSGSKPSMQIDWEQGKTMELEVILGNPVRLAKQHGLEMPRVQTVYALLKMAQTNRQRNQNNGKL